MSAMNLADVNSAIQMWESARTDSLDPEVRKESIWMLQQLKAERHRMIASCMANGSAINQVGFYESEEHDFSLEEGDLDAA